MSADIAERLRALSRCEHDDLSIGVDAADELDRLRARVAELERDAGRCYRERWKPYKRAETRQRVARSNAELSRTRSVSA